MLRKWNQTWLSNTTQDNIRYRSKTKKPQDCIYLEAFALKKQKDMFLYKK